MQSLSAGAIFGNYRIVRRIGHGGMGVVYEVVHQTLGKRAAIKVLHNAACTPSEHERFVREGRAAAAIDHHNAAEVFDIGVIDDTPFLVMEYLDGETLGALLKRTRRLPIADAADILVPILAALAAAHGRGIVHRDLKPDNIFLAKTKSRTVPKLLDFGISKFMEGGPSHTKTNALVGTPLYMAPEQVRGGKNVDVRADIYSMGVLLYEVVTGVHPTPADNLVELIDRVLRADYVSPREVLPSLPEPLEAIVLRAIRFDARERFASARAMGAALLPYASSRIRANYEEELSGQRGSAPPPDFAADEATSFYTGESQSVQTLTPPQSRAAAPLRDEGAPSPWSEVPEGRGDAFAGDVPSRALGAPDPFEDHPLSQAAQAAPKALQSAPESPSPTRVRNMGFVAMAVVGLALAILWLWPVARPIAPEPQITDIPATPVARPTNIDVALRTVPSTAEIYLDGELLGIGAVETRVRARPEGHEIEARAQGYRSVSVRFVQEAPPTILTLPTANTP